MVILWTSFHSFCSLLPSFVLSLCDPLSCHRSCSFLFRTQSSVQVTLWFPLPGFRVSLDMLSGFATLSVGGRGSQAHSLLQIPAQGPYSAAKICSVPHLAALSLECFFLSYHSLSPPSFFLQGRPYPQGQVPSILLFPWVPCNVQKVAADFLTAAIFVASFLALY